MARRAKREQENVVAALDQADVGVQAIQKGLTAARKRIEELEDQLEESNATRTKAEEEAKLLKEKLRKVVLTLE